MSFRQPLPFGRAAEVRQIMPWIGCLPFTVIVLPSRSANVFCKPSWRVR